jgi:hypothetical protein
MSKEAQKRVAAIISLSLSPTPAHYERFLVPPWHFPLAVCTRVCWTSVGTFNDFSHAESEMAGWVVDPGMPQVAGKWPKFSHAPLVTPDFFLIFLVFAAARERRHDASAALCFVCAVCICLHRLPSARPSLDSFDVDLQKNSLRVV